MEMTGKKAGVARFQKLDLTALILEKGWRTKAAILEYTQTHGTEMMQVWVHNNQKKLKEFGLLRVLIQLKKDSFSV